MRITYRQSDNKAYWASRWGDIPADQAMMSMHNYPLKYALETVSANDGPILEAGCGAGRILRYFHERGYDIIGIDFIPAAVAKLSEAEPHLKVEMGDISSLRFSDESFRYVLAFGLFHNLEGGLDEAVAESRRVLVSGGLLCASFRADNLQTRLTDWLAARRSSQRSGRQGQFFHKRNLTRREFADLLKRGDFLVESIVPVENMPIFYKFAFFRAHDHKLFDESKARVEGYRLSPLGRWLQAWLMTHFPDQFCNVYVARARKP